MLFLVSTLERLFSLKWIQFIEKSSYLNMNSCLHFRGVATWGGGGGRGGQRGHEPPTSFSEPEKIQKFQFQTSGILLFMGV